MYSEDEIGVIIKAYFSPIPKNGQLKALTLRRFTYKKSSWMFEGTNLKTRNIW